MLRYPDPIISHNSGHFLSQDGEMLAFYKKVAELSSLVTNLPARGAQMNSSVHSCLQYPDTNKRRGISHNSSGCLPKFTSRSGVVAKLNVSHCSWSTSLHSLQRL